MLYEYPLSPLQDGISLGVLDGSLKQKTFPYFDVLKTPLLTGSSCETEAHASSLARPSCTCGLVGDDTSVLF